MAEKKTLTTDSRTVTVDEAVMYVIEVNNDMAKEFGVDMTSAAAAAVDSKDALHIVKKLGLTGRAYIKTTKGKDYLILKGAPGQRVGLTGTRYLASNPKVAKLVISPKTLGAGAARMTGLAVVAYAGLRIAEHILSEDDPRLTQLFGNIAADVIKFGISAGAGFLAGVAVGTLTTVVAGPAIAAIVVGIGVGILLDRADRKFGLTESLVRAIEDGVDAAQSPFRKLARYINAWERHLVNQAVNNAMRFR